MLGPLVFCDLVGEHLKVSYYFPFWSKFLHEVLRSWMISWVQATNEIIRLLGLHDDYSSLQEAERMKLLAEVISSPPPVEKVEVCFLPSCC